MDNAYNIPTLKCLRCLHEWMPRKPQKPRTCPACHSPYWDVPRQKKEKKDGE